MLQLNRFNPFFKPIKRMFFLWKMASRSWLINKRQATIIKCDRANVNLISNQNMARNAITLSSSLRRRRQVKCQTKIRYDNKYSPKHCVAVLNNDWGCVAGILNL
mmetsp:Transcript_18692/g.23784  ORF Transcript_18692/g.23784 Transcript_18692/m.23784 type:complete len:105 (-) Transcript_18692:120-434(-)